VSAPFPWDDAQALALGVLRWPPESFWRATPRELMAAVEGLTGRAAVTPVGAADLDRLMRAYPDGA
jgi:uncharacterized phage protein (TIGR02216 family)